MTEVVEKTITDTELEMLLLSYQSLATEKGSINGKLVYKALQELKKYRSYVEPLKAALEQEKELLEKGS